MGERSLSARKGILERGDEVGLVRGGEQEESPRAVLPVLFKRRAEVPISPPRPAPPLDVELCSHRERRGRC